MGVRKRTKDATIVNSSRPGFFRQTILEISLSTTESVARTVKITIVVTTVGPLDSVSVDDIACWVEWPSTERYVALWRGGHS
jgi:hypothetical protein